MISDGQPPNVPDAEIYPLAKLFAVIGEGPPWEAKNMIATLDRQVGRLRARGIKVSRSSCLKAGGVDESQLRKIRDGNSPTLDTLVKIANGFRLSLGQLLGIEPLEPAARDAGYSLRVLRMAMGLAEQALQDADPPAVCPPEYVDKLAALTVPAYQMFAAALRADPNALSNEAALSIIVDRLKAELNNKDDDGS